MAHLLVGIFVLGWAWMTIVKLIEKLKERKPAISEAMLAQRDEWLSAVRLLFDEIETWLAPAVEQGVLKAGRADAEISEPDFGYYKAPVLRIEDARASVRLQPVAGHTVAMVASGGRRLTDLRGRVDLICGPFKVPLVRTRNGEWEAVPPRSEPRKLTEDTFIEILSEILLDE